MLNKVMAQHQDLTTAAIEDLGDVVEQLSKAHHIDAIMAVVRRAARELTGADGATFILREADNCYYADEDAMSPMWKGQRFPMISCISGWAMTHSERVVIEDIYKDPRIPLDLYKLTFVKSLVITPIRSKDPVGAIGTYWAEKRIPSESQIAILQTLANVTALAIENAALYTLLERQGAV